MATVTKAIITDATGQEIVEAIENLHTGIPAGGTTGTVLTKNSNTDYDVIWSEPAVKDVKLNGTTIVSGKVANIETIDDVTSTSTAPLSANQGRLLNERINNLSTVGRFLSIWNCLTGLPETEPTTIPYSYKAGDYFIVGTVDSQDTYQLYNPATVYNTGDKCIHESLYYICNSDNVTGPWDSSKWTAHTIINFKPYGTSYTGSASVVQETLTVNTGDSYYFDGSVWRLRQGIQGATVKDVQVNGSSIVSYGTANLTAENAPSIPVSKISDLTATATEINVLDGITATTTELNYTHGVTSNIQTQLNAKPDDLADLGVTATASELNTLSGITATTTELNYTDGVTSNIQTQLDSKQGSLPQVINDRYLHTNASTGTLEWSSVAQGGVTSITANNGLTGNATTGAVTIGMTNPMYYDSIASSIPVPVNADTLEEHPASYFQQALVSGTNIKTLNNESLLGSGNISINGAVWGNITGTLSNQTDLNTELTNINTAISTKQGKFTTYSNIPAISSVVPTALEEYCAWDTLHLYGYYFDVAITGITANSNIINIVMTDTLLASVGYVVTTNANSLRFYTQDATAVSGTILTLITSEVV